MPRAAKKTGRAVALSVNLPAGQPLMRAFAEKRLMQELQQLQLVSPPARLPACWLWGLALLTGARMGFW